ncbi:MAG: glycosyltransferase [Anaerolineaceae bacterium]|nr:glycosyltransferase [Anaerolineaceae bacterium]
MPTVLAVSRYFPPAGPAGASIRIVKLLKYAAQTGAVQTDAVQTGWSFVVLTQDPDRPVIREEKQSAFLLEELPAGTRVERVAAPFFDGPGWLRRLWGDSSLPWGVRTFWRGLGCLRRGQIDLVYANTPPFSNVAAAAALSWLARVPLVVDFKDDWVGSTRYLQKGKFRRRIEAAIEAAIVRRARAVCVVTRHSYAEYRRRYAAGGLADKIHWIPNGQDMDEFRLLFDRPRRIETQRFTLLSAAAGYRPDYRDLSPLLDGLGAFLRRCPEARQEIELVFLGEDPHATYLRRLQDMGLGAALHLAGGQDRRSLVEWLWKADLFFLVQPRGNRTAISGTLYEYWATGKAPTLLIAEPGASSALVMDHHFGQHVPFDQPEAAAAYLEQASRAYRAGRPLWVERAGVEQYDRRAIVEHMLACFRQAITPGEGGA